MVNFENKNLQELLYNYIGNRKLGIWGTGKSATDFLKEYNLNKEQGIIFFDNDSKKQQGNVYSINKLEESSDLNWFIVVASTYYPEIKLQLEHIGFRENLDFVDSKNLKFKIYSNLYRYETTVPEINFKVLDEIDAKFIDNKICLERFNLDKYKLEEFERWLDFGEFYNKKENKRYWRKVAEYYIAHKLLGLNRYLGEDIYIDIGAAISPFAKRIREKYNIDAYALDLKKPECFVLDDYYLEQDATNTSFMSNSVKGISLQCSFNLFIGKSDINFIKECGRILKKGGKAIISPLCMHSRYIATSSPEFYKKGYSDKDAKEYIRFDFQGIPSSRMYDVAHLYDRILSTAKRNNLDYTIYSIPNDQIIQNSEFVYLKYILEFIKF